MQALARLASFTAVVLGLQACGSVPYDPRTNNDTSAPTPAVIRVDASVTQLDSNGRPRDVAEATFEAKDRVLGQPQDVHGFVSDAANIDVLATATDNESGIAEVIVRLNRTVYYRASNGSIVSTIFPTLEVAKQTYTASNAQMPQMGAANLRTNIGGQRRFQNAAGNTVVGTGVTLQYFAEGKNSAGKVAYTDTVTITAGQTQ